MKRRLFHLLAALSLLLCIGCIGLAVLARYRSDTIGWAGWRDEAAQQWHGWGMNSEGSRLIVYAFRSGSMRFDDPTNMNGSVPGMLPHAFHHVMGSRPSPATLEWKKVPYSPSLTFYVLAMPHLLLAGAFGVAPLTAIGLRVKRRARERLAERRIAAGCCPSCGYDLRSSADRCPECGGRREGVPICLL